MVSASDLASNFPSPPFSPSVASRSRRRWRLNRKRYASGWKGVALKDLALKKKERVKEKGKRKGGGMERETRNGKPRRKVQRGGNSVTRQEKQKRKKREGEKREGKIGWRWTLISSARARNGWRNQERRGARSLTRGRIGRGAKGKERKKKERRW